MERNRRWYKSLNDQIDKRKRDLRRLKLVREKMKEMDMDEDLD